MLITDCTAAKKRSLNEQGAKAASVQLRMLLKHDQPLKRSRN
ncbi:MAG TPA: hypothetical protein V6D34_12875 [Candidatus Sericytochromatia bacterium]